jgi:hypothetical protein
VQHDAALAESYPRIAESPTIPPCSRSRSSIATYATLSVRPIASAADIPLSPLGDVNAMLVADQL